MATPHPSPDAPAPGRRPGWRLAVIGAGPAGLALALQAAQRLPAAEITLFDARPADKDVSADPRTLALSLGSVQLLRQLGAWPEAQAQPILEVLVSQAPPTLQLPWGPAEVRIRAEDERVAQLGAVLRYGSLVAALQAAWQAAEQAAPQRLHTRFGQPVAEVRNLGPGGGVEVDAGIAERFDLAVVAEGGVFADQARKAITHDYRQTAWVGTAMLQGGRAGCAVERFTRQGPLALLPLPPLASAPGDPASGGRPAAMVWCVDAADDPVQALDEAQRVALLNTLLPEAAGQVLAVSPLKRFALGLNAERTLVDRAVVRIGNAAQTLHPVAGQGLNLGLRDAAALVQALRGGTPAQLPLLLARLELQRAPDRWSMIAVTDFLARSFTWRLPGLPAARGLGLAALQALPPVRSLLARQMMFGRR